MAWQQPGQDNHGASVSKQGKRFLVAEIYKEEDSYALKYLTQHPDYNAAVNAGFKGHPAFKLGKEKHTTNILEIFIKRLPDRRRSDYLDFLKYYRISPDSKISDFALLGYTGGELPSDGFSFIHTLESDHLPQEFIITLAGTRHYLENLKSISVNDSVVFSREPENTHDEHAVHISINGKILGYVKKGQAETFSRWLQKFKIVGSVERINGSPTNPNVLIYGAVIA